MVQPWYGLVDCNNFYCSCEQIFDVSARGRAVVVLSNNAGNVISRSQEAKDLGIRMGAPTFTLKELMAEHHVRVYSSNYPFYGDISARVMNSLAELCPIVEVYSIDEAFVDLSIFPVSELVPFAQNVRYLVRKWTKIPTCVGIAPTKTLAKIANKLAKKEAAHHGVFAITDEATRREVLGRFEVGDVWGVGHQHLKRLSAAGVRTALHLAEKPDWWVRGVFGTVVAERMVRELRGEACIPMLEPQATSKNICCSRSFGLHLHELGQVKEAVATFADQVGQKLRDQRACAGVVTVFLHTNRFREDLPQYGNSVSVNLPVATSASTELVRYALAGLEAIHKTGYLYKKAGVVVTGIVPVNQVQAGLYTAADYAKLAKAASVVDRLNARFGRGTVRLAVQGGERAFWHQKVEKRSPRYTTRWKELPRVELDGDA